MLIAQITDLHVLPEGELCFGRVPTNQQLREAVAHVNALDPRPDAVIASGDLVDRPSEEAYAALVAILSGLIPPVYVIPGNHDDRDLLLETFADETYLPDAGAPFAHYAVDGHPIRLVGLDTTIPGRHPGHLCDARLAWLDRTLSAEPEKPTLVFMHHPPFRTGIRWMDSSGLRGGRRMEAIVSRHPQVERVACGHVHRPIQVSFGGTIACTAPSTCHQVALNLRASGGFEFAMEPRAVQLYLFDPGYGLVTHTSYVSPQAERFQPIEGLDQRALEQLDANVERGLKRLQSEFDARPPRGSSKLSSRSSGGDS